MNLLDEPGGMSENDLDQAREVAQFVADRAFLFHGHECRAWALSDFAAWAALAGHTPLLTLGRPETDTSTA